MSEQTIRGLFEQAQAAVAANRHDEAYELLLKVVNADPQNEQAWLLLSDVAPELQQSVACLQRVLALNPNNAQARSWLALAQAASSSTGGSSTRPAADRHVVGKLGEYLVELGFVTTAQVQAALQVQAEAAQTGQRRSVGEILVAQGLVTPAQVEQALREQLRDVYTLFVD